MTQEQEQALDYNPERESLDAALNGKVRLLQPLRGYRFSVDAVLLADFVPFSRKQRRIVDLGCGVGVVPLILLQQGKVWNALGVEVQTELAELACRNVELNNCTDKLNILHGDLRRIRDLLPPQSADAVTANPPFYPVASGRDNPSEQKAIARREHLCRMTDVVAAAKYLVTNRGRVYFIYPACRLYELFTVLQAQHLPPRRLRLVHPRQGEERLDSCWSKPLQRNRLNCKSFPRCFWSGRMASIPKRPPRFLRENYSKGVLFR